MSQPKILYKYTTTETTKIILENKTLRWSSPKMFNDILEFKNIPKFEPSLESSYKSYIHYLIDIVINDKSLDNYDFNNETNILINIMKIIKKRGVLAIRLSQLSNITEKNTAKIIKEIDKKMSDLEKKQLETFLINELTQECPITEKKIIELMKNEKKKWDIDKARVLCLTETPNNQAMWGTYCDNHYGCVLGFKTTIKDSCFKESKKIQYRDDLIIANGLEFLLYGDAEIAKKSNDMIYYTKKTRWSYEDEWRLLTFRFEEINNYGDYLFYEEELESITFGNRMEEKDRKNITLLLEKKYKKCKIFEIVENNGNFIRVLIK
jgi:hypothetical protein